MVTVPSPLVSGPGRARPHEHATRCVGLCCCVAVCCALSVVLRIRLSIFRPVTVVLGVAHPRETAPNTAAHGMASSPTSPRVVANITMPYPSIVLATVSRTRRRKPRGSSRHCFAASMFAGEVSLGSENSEITDIRICSTPRIGRQRSSADSCGTRASTRDGASGQGSWGIAAAGQGAAVPSR